MPARSPPLQMFLNAVDHVPLRVLRVENTMSRTVSYGCRHLSFDFELSVKQSRPPHWEDRTASGTSLWLTCSFLHFPHQGNEKPRAPFVAFLRVQHYVENGRVIR